MAYHEINEDEFRAILMKPPAEILVYMLQVAEISRRNPDWAPVVSYRHIPKEASKVIAREFGWLFCGRGETPATALVSEDEALAKLKTYVPFLDDLNMTGNYCLAGSCPIVACLKSDTGRISEPGDADFYPLLDTTLRRTIPDEVNIMRAYKVFLEDMDQVCDENSLIGEQYPYMQPSYTYRNRHCTTICRQESDNQQPQRHRGRHDPYYSSTCRQSFQIIHRAHTSPVSAVVGFDQICCKCFYDGNQIYYTLDAALALYFRINPIDWRRESPTHMARAKKYYINYGFTPIFPGLDFNLGRELVSVKNAEYYIARMKLRSENSWRPKGEKDATIEFRSMSRYGDDVINNDDYNRDQKDVHVVAESDYDGETEHLMILNYRCLSGAIKEQPEKMMVFSTRPLDIIDRYNTCDIRHTMRRLLAGGESNFYMGTDRTREICTEMKMLAVRVHGYHGVHVTMMDLDQMAQFATLQVELAKIYEARCTELEVKAMNASEHLKEVTFQISNPGSQFTASFNPIIRKRPEDYFGSKYVHVDLTISKQAKLFCLHLRKQGVLFRGWGIDLMKLLFFWVDRATIYSPMMREMAAQWGLTTGELLTSAKVIAYAIPTDLVVAQPINTEDPNPANPLPWKEKPEKNRISKDSVLYGLMHRSTPGALAYSPSAPAVQMRLPQNSDHMTTLAKLMAKVTVPKQTVIPLEAFQPASFAVEDNEDGSDDDESIE